LHHEIQSAPHRFNITPKRREKHIRAFFHLRNGQRGFDVNR
jgi:hypothetical protein